MWVAGFALFPCVDLLTKHCIAVLQGGHDMENPSTPKCAATDRSDDD